MPRYIDADILRKNEIARCHCVPCVGSNDNDYKNLDEVLNDCQTADVVEVVRCKDCRYFNGEICSCHSDNYGEHEVLVEADDYCSFGRREW